MTLVNPANTKSYTPIAETLENASPEKLRLGRPDRHEHGCVKICKPKKCEGKYFKHLQGQFEKLQGKAGFLKDHAPDMSRCELAKHLKEMRQLAKSVRWTIKQLPGRLQHKFRDLTENANDIASKLSGVNKCNARQKFHCVKPALCEALDLKSPRCHEKVVVKPWQPPAGIGPLGRIFVK